MVTDTCRRSLPVHEIDTKEKQIVMSFTNTSKAAQYSNSEGENLRRNNRLQRVDEEVSMRAKVREEVGEKREGNGTERDSNRQRERKRDIVTESVRDGEKMRGDSEPEQGTHIPWPV